jgi:Beta-1,4-xylanase
MDKNLLRFFEEQKDETNERIEADTKRYRKAYVKVNFKDKDGKGAVVKNVQIKQKSHDFKFGCNIFLLDEFPDAERNAIYRDEFKNIFNYAISPFYWSDFEVEEGKMRFTSDSAPVYRRPSPDKVIKYCNENGIGIKGHPLMWHGFVPEWLPRDRDEAYLQLCRRIKEIGEKMSDKIRDWDIVNEVLVAPYLQDKRLPNNYPLCVYEQAAKYFKNNRFFLNDVTEICWGPYYKENLSPYYLLIESLLSKGARIDALGMQYHLFWEEKDLDGIMQTYCNPERLFSVMDTYGEFNRPLHVSEITVPAYMGIKENEEYQAEITKWLYRIWFSHKNMEAIVWWNMVDGTAAYAPMGTYEGENKFAGGILGTKMQHKPVYNVMDDLINKEWKTNLSLKDCMGEYKFSGFFGTYEMTGVSDGKEFKKEFHISKDGNRKFDFTV